MKSHRTITGLVSMMIASGCFSSCEQFEHIEGPIEIGESPISVAPKHPIKALHKVRDVCLRLPKGTAWKYGLGVTREDGQVFQIQISAWTDAGKRTFRDASVWRQPKETFACMGQAYKGQTLGEQFLRFEFTAQPKLFVEEILFRSYVPK